MNNETLKRDLCARLMEGVKVKNQYGDVCTLVSVSNRLNSEFEYKESGGRTDYSSFKGIKPYLFSTSALTKEIQIANYNNGEPFVPIVEINRLASTNKEVSQCIEWGYSEDHFLINVDYFIGGWEVTFITDLLNRWHINYRLSPDQFIEVTDEFNPYK